MTWDGKERRKGEDEDRDMLIRIDANLTNFINRFNEHIENDEKSFKELRDGQDVLKRYVYLGVGGLVVLEFVINFLKRVAY